MKSICLVMRVSSCLLGAVVIGFMGMSVARAANTTAEETSGFSLPPLTAVDASKRGEWERLGEEADRLLADRSFVENWRAQASFRTPAGARRALAEADDRLKEIDHAVQKKSGACLYTFFVNRCVNEARKTSYQRKREIRNLMSDARVVLHGEEVKERKKERLAREAEKKQGSDKDHSQEDRHGTQNPRSDRTQGSSRSFAAQTPQFHNSGGSVPSKHSEGCHDRIKQRKRRSGRDAQSVGRGQSCGAGSKGGETEPSTAKSRRKGKGTQSKA